MRTLCLWTEKLKIGIQFPDEIRDTIENTIFSSHLRQQSNGFNKKYIIQKEKEKYLLIKENKIINRNRKLHNIVYSLESRIIEDILKANRNKLILHSACMIFQDSAYLFIGNSGTGKTTISLFLTSQGWEFAGDEFALLNIENYQVTPLIRNVILKNELELEKFLPHNCNKYKISEDLAFINPNCLKKISKIKSYPISKAFFLTKNRTISIRKMSQTEVIQNILPFIYNPYRLRKKLLNILENLVKTIRFYHLKIKHPLNLNKAETIYLIEKLTGDHP